MPTAPGNTDVISQGKTFTPCLAPSVTLGRARTKAATITHPNIPETATERSIPRGTFTAALTVSSEVCAEASKPVIV